MEEYSFVFAWKEFTREEKRKGERERETDRQKEIEKKAISMKDWVT